MVKLKNKILLCIQNYFKLNIYVIRNKMVLKYLFQRIQIIAIFAIQLKKENLYIKRTLPYFLNYRLINLNYLLII